VVSDLITQAEKLCIDREGSLADRPVQIHAVESKKIPPVAGLPCRRREEEE